MFCLHLLWKFSALGITLDLNKYGSPLIYQLPSYSFSLKFLSVNYLEFTK